MNKVNILALGAIAVAIISIFLPWLEVFVANGTSGSSEGLQQITIQGITIGYGIFGLLVSLIGGFLVYKESRWTFIAGIVNLIDGYGYLKGWFGDKDSGNYGDVASRSSVDPKFGLYLFIFASLAFIFFTLKFYKQKKTVTILPSEPDIKDYQQPITRNTVSSQVYQPSKIQTMTTTPTSETPNGPEQTETPQVPVQSTETSSEQPGVTPNEPVHAFVPKAAPVIHHQAPQATTPPQPPVTEPEKKKSSTSLILIIILAIVLVGSAVFVMTNNSSEKSKDKTETLVNNEKARLDSIINEVNQAVSDKKYDDALLKINSINWLYEPETNRGYVDQYNNQRENLRKTIEQQKTSDQIDIQNKAIEEAVKAPVAPVQTTDSIQ